MVTNCKGASLLPWSGLALALAVEEVCGHAPDGIEGAQEMFGQDRGRARRVAREAGLEQGLMFGMDVACNGLAEQADAAVAFGLLIENVLEMSNPA